MPFDLGSAVEPAATALLISECQRDVVGDLSRLPALAEAAAAAVENTARLAAAARLSGVQVVHGTALTRRDGKGANRNTRLNAGLRRQRAVPVAEAGEGQEPAAPGATGGAEPVPSIGVAPEDIVVQRLHGMSPLHDTGVDSVLRNLGVRTLVVVGVSLNIAIPNSVMDAVNRGYSVVVPTDAVAGVPAEYGEAVLQHTVGYLAYLTSTDELLRIWRPGEP
ncbi:MAG: isochorismatase family protein [Acidimicrobiales bacterium]